MDNPINAMMKLRHLPGLCLLLLAICSLPVAAQDDDLLPPEQAFALSAWVEGDSLVAEYQIAPGYYMYRERFEFELESSDQPARFAVDAAAPQHGGDIPLMHLARVVSRRLECLSSRRLAHEPLQRGGLFARRAIVCPRA